jgi:hypothetical protein
MVFEMMILEVLQNALPGTDHHRSSEIWTIDNANITKNNREVAKGDKSRLRTKMMKPTNTRKKSGNKSQFPGRLHSLMEHVEEQGIEGVISWVLGGRGIIVADPDRLVEILPFFFSQTKYRSFRRQLNMWHFERIEKGPCTGAFVHPYFVRGDRQLSMSMSRNVSLKPRRTNAFASAGSVAGSSTVSAETRKEIASSNTITGQGVSSAREGSTSQQQAGHQDSQHTLPSTRTVLTPSFQGPFQPSPLTFSSCVPSHKAAQESFDARCSTRAIANFLNQALTHQTKSLFDLGRSHLEHNIVTRRDLFDEERAIPNFIQQQMALDALVSPSTVKRSTQQPMMEAPLLDLDPLEDIAFEECDDLDCLDLASGDIFS